MPPSIPAPINMPASDAGSNKSAEGKRKGTLEHLPSFDWRRLHPVELDHVVDAYGVQAASIWISDRQSNKEREEFRYGTLTGVESTNLSSFLIRKVQSIADKGRHWKEHATRCQNGDAPQPHPKDAKKGEQSLTNICKYPNPLSCGVPAADSGTVWPKAPLSQQLGSPNAPSLMLYLAYRQVDFETRIIEQMEFQAQFHPKQWAGSEGEQELKRLTGRMQPPQDQSWCVATTRPLPVPDHDVKEPSPRKKPKKKAGIKTSEPESKQSPAKPTSTSSTPSPSKPSPAKPVLSKPGSSKPSPTKPSPAKPSPAKPSPAKQNCDPGPSKPAATSSHQGRKGQPQNYPRRRILIAWNIKTERCAIDRLAPELLNLFDVWVDLQEVVSSVLHAVTGEAPRTGTSPFSLKKAMSAVGFVPGYSLQPSNMGHDPGMDAVRTLGVLSRFVAYPAAQITALEQQAKRGA